MKMLTFNVGQIVYLQSSQKIITPKVKLINTPRALLTFNKQLIRIPYPCPENYPVFYQEKIWKLTLTRPSLYVPVAVEIAQQLAPLWQQVEEVYTKLDQTERFLFTQKLFQHIAHFKAKID